MKKKTKPTLFGRQGKSNRKENKHKNFSKCSFIRSPDEWPLKCTHIKKNLAVEFIPSYAVEFTFIYMLPIYYKAVTNSTKNALVKYFC